ncbi:hypothetical protein OH492_17930 [Vibrio chagasii]|nr:hypothetical protein [Vibrio chagasii]
MESGGGDWTSAGGQDQGVDFTDDSGSFDSDSQSGNDQGNTTSTKARYNREGLSFSLNRQVDRGQRKVA